MKKIPRRTAQVPARTPGYRLVVTAVKRAGRNSSVLGLSVYLSEFTHGLAYLAITQPSYLMFNVNVMSTYQLSKN